MIDPRIKEWATARQGEYIDAVNQYGSIRKAAKILKVDHSTVGKSVRAAGRRAALAGYSPEHDMTKTVPDGFGVKGVSTLYGDDGQVKVQWVKSQRNEQDLYEAMKEAIASLVEDVHGQAKPIKAPKRTTDQAMTLYPMGDPHIGMYAWSEECGEDFDCDIARANLSGAMARLVGCAPNTDIGTIINVGDFFHADNLNNSTMRSGNPLDVDTRWPRVLELGVLAMRDCIDMALRKHKEVKVINAIGNHDDHSSVMLSMCLSAFYHNEPRVTIEKTISKFHYVEFHKNLLGVTHGDTVKMQDLAGLMSVDKPEAWGRTQHRYWLTGHIHHRQLWEQPGCLVESFRTLAGKDSYHSAHGYRAGRDMVCIVIDKDHGEVERHRVDISMLNSDD